MVMSTIDMGEKEHKNGLKYKEKWDLSKNETIKKILRDYDEA